MKGSLIILSFFAAGTLLALLGFVPQQLLHTDYSMYALYVLMLLVGISIGADKSSWQVLRSMNLKIVLVPVVVIVGTLLGAAAFSFFLPQISPKEGIAVGAGFGYYSLSSVLIKQLHSDSLSVVALLANIIRETATLLLTPLFVRYFGKLAGIAAAGATAMDTALPIIARYSGKEYAVVAVFSGVVLTVLVPFAISLILQ